MRNRAADAAVSLCDVSYEQPERNATETQDAEKIIPAEEQMRRNFRKSRKSRDNRAARGSR